MRRTRIEGLVEGILKAPRAADGRVGWGIYLDPQPTLSTFQVGGIYWSTWRKPTTIGRALTNSSHMSVPRPIRDSNPRSHRWKAHALTIEPQKPRVVNIWNFNSLYLARCHHCLHRHFLNLHCQIHHQNHPHPVTLQPINDQWFRSMYSRKRSRQSINQPFLMSLYFASLAR